jgi:glutamate-1-semialdehyde 2,1-aminomutase
MIVKTANKCYVTDTEGNIYIDTTMGSGAQIIGHNNPLIKRIGEKIKRGTIYSIPNQHTDKVNCYLKEHINPDFDEQYIFCNSGTEANMRAIRLARAYTGKNLVGRFHGGWHGGLDGFLEEHPDNKGIPAATDSLFKVLPYNDDKCFEQITSDMAAVIVEPVQGSNPRSDIKQFLQKLRDRCTKTGVLLIFDEIMTGFRLSAKGGAGVFDVRPDIVTYGKVLGGGFPIGAVGGKTEIMKTKNVFYGGTFSANPLSMYAAKLILETIIDKKYIQYDKLNNAGKTFRDELNKFFIKQDKEMRVMGYDSLNRIIFTDRFIRNRKERDELEPSDAQKIFSEKLERFGVFVNWNGLYHFSMAHTPEVVEDLISTIKRACNQDLKEK